MSSAQSQPAPENSPAASRVLPEEMGLEEVMRVMDVASTLRKEQEIVEREFNLEKTKQMLRDKLIRTAELTGEELTPEQVEAAVNWYYDNLHEYEEPEKSLNWYLAHLYVARGWIMKIFLPIALAMGAIWSLWFAPFAPFSDSNQKRKLMTSLQVQIEKDAQFAMSIAASDHIAKEIQKLKMESSAHFDSGNVDGLKTVQEKIADIEKIINEEYTITVVSGPNQKSGIDTYQENGDQSGYYLIVQARDANGNPLKQRIKNIETDSYHTVETWAEKVPKSVYDRLAQDKTEDGILNETVFATKKRGEMEVEMVMPGDSNSPIKRIGQITEW